MARAAVVASTNAIQAEAIKPNQPAHGVCMSKLNALRGGLCAKTN